MVDKEVTKMKNITKKIVVTLTSLLMASSMVVGASAASVAFGTSSSPNGCSSNVIIRSNGSDMPERIRVRAPTEVNWHGMKYMLEGQYLADVPITIAAIDPCYSCTDRAIVINSGDKTDVTDWQGLRQYSIDWYKKRGVDVPSVQLPEPKKYF
jgi:Ni,Fe-hydrogenase III large subunit